MEISKINSVNFAANHQNIKTGNRVSLRSADTMLNTHKTDGRKKLFAFGLTAAAITAGTILLYKKTSVLDPLTEKIKSLNPFKKTVTIPDNSNKTNANITKGNNTAKPVVENSKVEITTPKIENTAETAEKSGIVEDKVSQVHIEQKTEAAQTLKQDVSEVKDESLPLKKRRRQIYNENTLQEDNTKIEVQEEKIGLSKESAPKEDIAIEKQENTNIEAITKKIKSAEEIAADSKANLELINERIKQNSNVYGDFGIDEEILGEFVKLDPDMIKEFNDDKFLSYILAPRANSGVTQKDLMIGTMQTKPTTKFGRISLKNSKLEEQDRLRAERIKLYHISGDILENKGRIEKIRELEKNFTPEEIHKVFNAEDKSSSDKLLKWMLNFYTNKGQNGSDLIKAIKVLIA